MHCFLLWVNVYAFELCDPSSSVECVVYSNVLILLWIPFAALIVLLQEITNIRKKSLNYAQETPPAWTISRPTMTIEAKQIYSDRIPKRNNSFYEVLHSTKLVSNSQNCPIARLHFMYEIKSSARLAEDSAATMEAAEDLSWNYLHDITIEKCFDCGWIFFFARYSNVSLQLR